MQGRKPITSEWGIFKYYGLDTKEWLVQKSTPTFLQILNKATKEIRRIDVPGAAPRKEEDQNGEQ